MPLIRLGPVQARPPSRFPTVLGYKLTRRIGGGGSGTVFHAVDRNNGSRVAACKVIVFQGEGDESTLKAAQREVMIHGHLIHPNVVKYIGGVTVEFRHAEKYTPGFYILLELAAGGDLFDKIPSDVGVGQEVAHFYFQQPVSGMIYVHSRGICHRDLKPQNVLLDGRGHLKISDFGMAAVSQHPDTSRKRLFSNKGGTVPYMAPEMFAEGKYDGVAVDLWGVGVLLFCLLAGDIPWARATSRSPHYSDYINNQPVTDPAWFRLGSATSLVRSLLAINPSERISLLDCLAHPWAQHASPLAGESPDVLVAALTQSLRRSGELAIAAPPLENTRPSSAPELDHTHSGQLSQTLLELTTLGDRRIPQLTRFYSYLGPRELQTAVMIALDNLNVTCHPALEEEPSVFRIHIVDNKDEAIAGRVEVEHFVHPTMRGGLCVMVRENGNPLAWRRLWKLLIEASSLQRHIFRPYHPFFAARSA
ncbi:kinase-like domain-containing protein [Mycena sp. CBHHK59/15]|nr:kinase-like domain-containing protein [Mycena sp. CBHHK59/15]